jgi:shikimate dehydrogenase
MRCAVLGDPVEHSLSPVLHRAAYAALGLDWTYDAVRVPAGGLSAFLAGLGPEWRGLSLTMPLKREAVPLLTSQDRWTQASGSANTVLLDPAGGRHGLNTDVPGAEAALAAVSDCSRSAAT